MKKSLFVLVLLALFSVALFGCDLGKKNEEFEVAVVTDIGQLNDGGFNQGTYEGAVAFAKATGKTYKYYQPANGSTATDNDRIAAMRQAIENGAKVIVTPGFLQATALQTVAAESPDVKFVFIDGWSLGLDNVTAVSYKEEESGFFAGYAAVMDGYVKLGGTFGGGGTNAACNRFAYGYVQGIEAAAAIKGVEPVVKISFQNGSSFSASPELVTQIAGWYNEGVEVVFSCGGSMLQSVKQAAAEYKDQGAKIIGVDVDQAKESEQIITSAVKGLSASVQIILNLWNEGKWDAELANKTSNLGAADNATGLPTAADSWRFATFTVAEYNELFESVKNGTITIKNSTPDNMNSSAVWEAIEDDFNNTTIIFE